MHKKISLGMAITIALLTFIATAIVTTAVTMVAYSSVISDIPKREAMYGKLADIDSIIRSDYLGNAEKEDINSAAADGYVSRLKIGNNRYLNADEYTAYKQQSDGPTDGNGEKQTGVSYKKFGSAGYIKISDFYSNSPAAFKDACEVLESNGVNGIVIDLRDCESSNIEFAAEIIDIIVPLAANYTEAIATAVGKDGKNIRVFSADSASMDMTFAVIVNENTKGAGELIAADLRDFGKARIFGKTTAGDGTYQKLYELSEGDALLLTVGEILPYSGTSYNGKGVVPDYEIDGGEPTDDLNNDVQFLKAYGAVFQ